MAATGDWDLVCCGHSHKAKIERLPNIRGGETPLVNPGTVGGVVNMAVLGFAAIQQSAMGWILDRNWQGAMVEGARIYDAAAYHAAFTWLAVSAVTAASTAGPRKPVTRPDSANSPNQAAASPGGASRAMKLRLAAWAGPKNRPSDSARPPRPAPVGCPARGRACRTGR
jgi:hypothetical protein